MGPRPRRGRPHSRNALQQELVREGMPEEQQRAILTELERRESDYMRLQRQRMSADDFEPLTIIGRGAFGEVRAGGGWRPAAGGRRRRGSGMGNASWGRLDRGTGKGARQRLASAPPTPPPVNAPRPSHHPRHPARSASCGSAPPARSWL
jgi:hypothetical protein